MKEIKNKKVLSNELYKNPLSHYFKMITGAGAAGA